MLIACCLEFASCVFIIVVCFGGFGIRFGLFVLLWVLVCFVACLFTYLLKWFGYCCVCVAFA